MSRTTLLPLQRWRYPAVSLVTLTLLAACGGGDSTAPAAPVVASVEVRPAQQSLFVGDALAYTARVLDTRGTEIQGRAVTWSSTDAGIATVSTTGMVTALAAGQVQLRATVDGKVGSGSLAVSIAPVATATITPANPTLTEGEVADLAVVARDAAGRVLEGRTTTWQSSATSVAPVSATGTVTALSAGIATITATVGGIAATTALTVNAATVDRVSFGRATLTVAEGESKQLAVTVTGAAGRVLEGRTVAWSSNDPERATVDATGKLTALQPGNIAITATVQGRAATLAVTVTRAAVASVQLTPGAFVLEIGESRPMTAVVRDAAGKVLDGRTVTFAVTAGATISPAGVLTAVRNGYLTITAMSEGVTATVAATVVPGEEYAYDLLYHRYLPNGASELFTIPVGTGSAPSRLNAGAVSRNASPSPDGLRVAFAVSQEDLTTRQRVDDIFAVDVSGMNMKQLTNAAGYEDQPAWSPTGGRIAYHHFEFEGRSDIWVMAPDGSGQLNLTADMPTTGLRSSPAWSKDGTRIAFSQIETTVAGSEASIWTMRADGTDKRKLTGTFTGFDASPTWSSDGRSIAFARYYNGDRDITIVDVNGNVSRRIALPGLQGAPSWSPDGRWIAFTQNAGIITNLFTMRPDGTELRLRTVDAAWGGGLDPAWIVRR